MSRQKQIYVFGALLAVLALVTLWNLSRSPELGSVLASDEKYEPLKVENPELRLDLLERIRKLEYSGTHRNIFSASLPPPPVKVEPKKEESQAPPPPPPLTLPFRFYGYSSDPKTGKRQAFFTDGDTVWIAAEGDTLLKRYRLLRIGNATAEFEEIASGRRATLPLEVNP